jgi:hypothetical protein
MRKNILIMLIMCTISLIIVRSPVYAAEWDEKDTGLLLLRIIDWGQTRNTASNDWFGTDKNGFDVYNSEINPLLGKHPSLKTIDTYFVSLLLIDWYIHNNEDKLLKLSKWWQYSNIVVETGLIGHNYNLGWKFSF